MTGVSDSFDRPINYLRISVTDRCNLRCVYCMPSEGIRSLPHEDILSYEEIVTVTRAAVEMGIRRVRLTGGEPLVRGGIISLVEMLAGIEGITDLSLTTNGILLPKYAKELKSAGLIRVNISLDSLKPDRFAEITRVGQLRDVLEGIEIAKSVGIDPVKINVVVMRGINDDEILDFARMSLDQGWHVRYIEFMPIAGNRHLAHERFVPISEIREQIEARFGQLLPGTLDGSGPAKYFKTPQASGTIGFISPVSEHFCFRCNRLRLTADGRLLNCLLSDNEIDLREALRRNAPVDEIRGLLKHAIQTKPAGHDLGNGHTRQGRNMSQIGG